MRKRWKWLAALAGTVIVVVALVTRWRDANPPDGIGPAAFGRIVPGMSRSEVCASIGFPPGDYHNPPLYPPPGHRPPSMGPFGVYVAHWGIQPTRERRDGRWIILTANGEEATLDRWGGGRYWIHVLFGPDGKAVGCTLYREMDNGRDSAFVRLRNWAASQWQKWFPER